MICTKVKIPKEAIVYDYDNNYDILNIYIDKPIPAVAEEIYPGVYLFIDDPTDNVIGASILDYSKRDKKYIRKILPFDIDFNYINSKII
ncbi:hypothetical protein [Thermovenabulum gondwanense]|uniref:DUF2283 domain-containing protein n=1 Tax=Thermovenabulum gondwanense TaxID=520767 RepID=A0A161QCC5_9FIRM|nr:hypothetical protein [Thermovenabulum gondwanense]KYO66898.1 hypothetical protein ATZ99_07150 [Thermovenabulum gondwanense]